MKRNVTQKLIASHLVDGEMIPGREIALRIDQTLTQDATGTMVMLELEAMELERVKTEVSAQYVDHNLLQEDNKNADDHIFLWSACRRFGVWYSRPGGGVSHPVHMQRLGIPGKTLLGSDSHTCSAGSLGMLAIGAGGIDVAMAMAGEPFYVKMPKVRGVRLTGRLPEWVSAKDVILEMLRRHNVDGGIGQIIEYYGDGLDCLSAMDRHVIANMGAELGATTSVFPSDAETRRFMTREGREGDWIELTADPGATYDIDEEIDLSTLEPLIAKPSSPGNVVAVREVAGTDLYQAYIGSSASPGWRDFVMPALMLKGRRIPAQISYDVNPSSRELLENLIKNGHIAEFIRAGGRLHQAGCNGCIGMGQAPASGRNSLRTVPRNFPGRSGTREDSVWLCSPETATASALAGVITDPRTLGIPYPRAEELAEPADWIVDAEMLEPPLPIEEARRTELIKRANIVSLPRFEPLAERIEVPVLLKVGDDISTDDILPAGARVLPYRSNIPKISEFVYERIEPTYAARARKLAEAGGGHAIVGGANYGQGSSREHAAIAPRFLGLQLVISVGFARIHFQNLVNFGVLPLTFADPADYAAVQSGDVIVIEDVSGQLGNGGEIKALNKTQGRKLALRHALSERQIQVLRAGGLINQLRNNREPAGAR